MATLFFTLLFLFLFILVIKMVIYPWYIGPAPYYDPYVEDVTTHTTTTTTTTQPEAPQAPQWNIVGNLERKKARNGQYYVMDPVDKDKVWLNSTDDLYEDGAGKIWKLV